VPELIPFRWPVEWKDASRLELLKGTPINCLVGDAPPPFPLGDLQFSPKDRLPAGVAVREGAWPRVLPAETKKDAAEAGATGAAWVDSNAGLIRLAQTMEREARVAHHAAAGGKGSGPAEEFARAVAEACATAPAGSSRSTRGFARSWRTAARPACASGIAWSPR